VASGSAVSAEATARLAEVVELPTEQAEMSSPPMASRVPHTRRRRREEEEWRVWVEMAQIDLKLRLMCIK
jgi:hypothetical protein